MGCRTEEGEIVMQEGFLSSALDQFRILVLEVDEYLKSI